MRKFIKYTLLFSSVLLLLTVLLIELPEYYLETKADFKLPKDTKHLFIGHSHSQCSINDELINNLTNVSGSGEAYFYTYLKTARILEQNPSIETVFIEFTNNQITPTMDDWTWGDNYVNHRFPKYSPFMTAREKFLIASNNFKGFVNSNSISSSENLKRIFKSNYRYIDETNKTERSFNPELLDSLILDAKPKKAEKPEGLSEVNLEYLDKIIQLCQKQRIRVILIRSPLHENYLGISNEAMYQDVIKERFSELEYYDFSKFPLDNSNFYDLEHLNDKGASVFSVWFNNVLQDPRFSSNNSSQFLKNEVLKLKHR